MAAYSTGSIGPQMMNSADSNPTEIFAGRFNHCASICKSYSGITMAWYSGSGECQDDQSVHTLFMVPTHNHGFEARMGRLDDKTGNPVLWVDDSGPLMLWSKFEPHPITKLTDRWKHCSIWVSRLDGYGKIRHKPVLLAKADEHLLGRCAPICVDDRPDAKDPEWIIPLYDEVNEECVLYKGTYPNYKPYARFGQKQIQPTIWKTDGGYRALSRNFNSPIKQAILNKSVDGASWDAGIQTDIRNINSSLCITTWRGHQFIIWNDSNTAYRTNLTLGLVADNGITPIAKINRYYGSYPSACVIDDKLYYAYTNNNKRISYGYFDWSDIRRHHRNNESEGDAQSIP